MSDIKHSHQALPRFMIYSAMLLFGIYLSGMFKGMKKMAIKAMMSRQLKGMPKAMQEKILAMVETNPEFFEKMAKEIKMRTDAGQDKMMAMQTVAKEHQAELQKMFMGGK